MDDVAKDKEVLADVVGVVGLLRRREHRKRMWSWHC